MTDMIVGVMVAEGVFAVVVLALMAVVALAYVASSAVLSKVRKLSARGARLPTARG